MSHCQSYQWTHKTKWVSCHLKLLSLLLSFWDVILLKVWLCSSHLLSCNRGFWCSSTQPWENCSSLNPCSWIEEAGVLRVTEIPCKGHFLFVQKEVRKFLDESMIISPFQALSTNHLSFHHISFTCCYTFCVFSIICANWRLFKPCEQVSMDW